MCIRIDLQNSAMHNMNFYCKFMAMQSRDDAMENVTYEKQAHVNDVVKRKNNRERKQVHEIIQPAFDDKKGEGNHPSKFQQEFDAGEGQAKVQGRCYHSVHAANGTGSIAEKKKAPDDTPTPHEIERQKMACSALWTARNGFALDDAEWR